MLLSLPITFVTDPEQHNADKAYWRLRILNAAQKQVVNAQAKPRTLLLKAQKNRQNGLRGQLAGARNQKDKEKLAELEAKYRELLEENFEAVRVLWAVQQEDRTKMGIPLGNPWDRFPGVFRVLFEREEAEKASGL